jgi:LytS/YehU family sensor histidine kinase
MGKRLPLEGPVFVRNLTIHLLAAFPVAGIHILTVNFLNGFLFSWLQTYRPPIPLTAILIGVGATNVMIYWGILAASQALTYFRRYQDRDFRLIQSQLQVLKMQLHPHFLFNTLNAISELVHEDAARAEQLITQLADLLRLSLNSETTQEIALNEELDFLRLYIDIQQTLLQDRLKIDWNVAPETLDACVPSMILQPLIENSIQHGIAPRARGGSIKISSHRLQNKLLLNIEDDGIGFKAAAKSKNGGVGLKNVRARLQHLYGDAQELVLQELTGEGGINVVLKIPFRESTSTPHCEPSQYNFNSLHLM